MNDFIKYYSPAGYSGYGRAARDYIAALIDSGKAVSWHPLLWRSLGNYDIARGAAEAGRIAYEDGATQIEDYLDRRLIPHIAVRDFDCDTVFAHWLPETWPHFWEPGRQRIGYTVWETDRIPSHWAPLLNDADKLIVPSNFSRRVFQGCGISRPIYVVPHIANRPGTVSRQRVMQIRKTLGIHHDHYIFYSINEWRNRKAVWLTLRAFCQAFTAVDPVSLVIKTSRIGTPLPHDTRYIDTSAFVYGFLQGYKNPPHVCIVADPITNEELEALHALGDCYVSLTHAEGWGLGAFEAGARAKPVVMTGWGGQLDYLSAQNSYLVDYDLTPVTECRIDTAYSKNQNWAAPNVGHASSLLKWVYENRQRARQRGLCLADDILGRYGAAAVGESLLAAVNA